MDCGKCRRLFSYFKIDCCRNYDDVFKRELRPDRNHGTIEHDHGGTIVQDSISVTPTEDLVRGRSLYLVHDFK